MTGSDEDHYQSKRRKVDHDEEKGAENMSIDETNKLRAKLGLAPLEITTDEKAEDGTITIHLDLDLDWNVNSN